jgi:hypothetical protein
LGASTGGAAAARATSSPREVDNPASRRTGPERRADSRPALPEPTHRPPPCRERPTKLGLVASGGLSRSDPARRWSSAWPIPATRRNGRIGRSQPAVRGQTLAL